MLWSYVKNISYKIERAEGTSAIKKQVLLRNNPGDEIASPRSRRLLPESHPHRRPIPNFLTNGIQGYKMKRAPISKESAKGKFWTCVFTLTLWVMGKVTPTPLSIFSKENKMYGRLAVYGKSTGVAESQAKGGMNLLTSIQFKILNNPKINPVPPRHNFRRRKGAAAGCSRPQETTLKPKLK